MIVHILLEGRALCGMPGLPGEWPEGHAWLAFNDSGAVDASCAVCLSAATHEALKHCIPDEILTRGTEGKYDGEAAAVLEVVAAEATVVIVKGGARGDGFSVAVDLRKTTAQTILDNLPRVLRSVAAQIEQQEREKKEGLQ